MLIPAKLLFWVLCASLQLHTFSISLINVTALLTALILSVLPQIIRTDLFGERGLHLITGINWSIFLLSAFLFPGSLFYLPLAAMDIFRYRLTTPGILCALVLLINPAYALPLLLLSLVSILLTAAISEKEHLAEEIRHLRDTSRERELLIEEKNRRLIEKQDTDIYAATLKERNRIAREIHDNVGHMLTRSILQVGAIKTINTNEALAEPLSGLHETLNTAMTNIRNSVHDLHDESIDLHAALKEITEPVQVPCIRLEYDMGTHLPKTVKYCFIAITKEAVNNTLKHSNATRMTIIAQEHPAFYQLYIEDNGTTKGSSSEGIGLTNMRDRVRALDGNIKISTENGFKILISIIKSS